LSIDTLQSLLSNIVAVPILFTVVLLLLRAIIMTAAELVQPANVVPYRNLWWRDGMAWIAYTFAIVPIAFGLNKLIGVEALRLPGALVALPLALRLAMFTVLVDLGYYWVHRFMHTRHVWRVHKWHHSPTHIYWLSGVRASLLQQTLADVPFVALGALLSMAPWWLAMFMVIKGALVNDWMHLNVPWGGRWLEWFIVTPRYHRIHHSDDPTHYRCNLATLLPVWDRLFGTYVDPGHISRKLVFGINEDVSAARLSIGV
jgi:sterol desaturase/sphingolipid hydroxylase (fatty acid hydroxylase superfamily)